MMPHPKPNPFSSSRVDTPFQQHADLKELYKEEYERLKTIISEIKADIDNHQSRGAIVLGEPGSGKTHLMMRLAKEFLATNRLLFIRQPNNLNSVLYHIYSRVLESLAEPIPHSSYSQLEHLLANSFAKIILNTFQEQNSHTGILDYFRKLTDKDKFIRDVLFENPLNLYKKLGNEGARSKREYWQRIEIIIDDWWKRKYGDVGYASAILQGIVKFCSYSDPNKKKLVGKWLSAQELDSKELESIDLAGWPEEVSQETFSLEALTVLGRLSIMDEPLLIIFDQLEALGLDYNQNLLLSFGDAVKELFTYVPNSVIILNLFPQRWAQFRGIFDVAVLGRISQEQLNLSKPTKEQLKQILALKAQAQGVNIHNLLTSEDIADILSQGSIREVINRASHYYRFRTQGIPLPVIPSQIKSFEEEVKEQLEELQKNFSLPSQQALSSEEVEQTVANGLNSFQKEVNNGFQNLMAEIVALRTMMAKNISPLTVHEMVEDANSAPVPDEQSEQNDQKKGTTGKSQTKTSKRRTHLKKSFSEQVTEYLKREKAFLEEQYDKLTIISDDDDLGKLKLVAETFILINEGIELDYLRLNRRQLPQHLLIKTRKQNYVIGFAQVSSSIFPPRTRNFTQLANQYPDYFFTLIRDAREVPITGPIGQEVVNRLNSIPNGEFMEMDKDNRISFDLVYQLFSDIQNREVNFPLPEALHALSFHLEDYWLLNIFR